MLKKKKDTYEVERIYSILHHSRLALLPSGNYE